jgi:hypothetical protein
MHQACSQWRAAYDGSDGPPESWCGDMATWMNGYMMNGQTMNRQMMGSRMAADAARVRDACRAWIETGPQSGAAPHAMAWCDGMAGWMMAEQPEG